MSVRLLIIWLTFFLIASIFCNSVYGNDWFVRPPRAEGFYGSNNGKSYDDAWSGLNAVVWGTNGVQAGDTPAHHFVGLYYD